MLRITLLYQTPADGLTAAAVVSAANGFVLRSLSDRLPCSFAEGPTEILRRFSSSLPPLFAARRCATLLYVRASKATA